MPAQFDLRPDGVTPAKSQGQCGACWAFGAIGSLESSVKLATGEEVDYSENHLKNWILPEEEPCGGGNFFVAKSYASRWFGPVLESEDPYVPDSTDSSPPNLSPARLVTEVVELPFYGGEVSRDQVKKMIMDFGAVASSLLFDQEGDAYNPITHSYYYDGEFTEETNHAVLLVGWDDHYPASNFFRPPPGDGAWIAKNSWGRDWGENGFYYLSFYDTIVGFECHAFSKSIPPGLLDDVYEHDRDGIPGEGWGDGGVEYSAVRFTAASDTYVKAVGIDTFGFNTEYAVTVYKNESDWELLAGDPQPTIEGTLPYPGYFTVALGNGDIPLTAGENFTVVLRTMAPPYEDPVLGTIDVPSTPTMWKFDESGSLEPQYTRSFYSNDGVYWDDFADFGDGTMTIAAGLRVFTGDEIGRFDDIVKEDTDPGSDTDESKDTEIESSDDIGDDFDASTTEASGGPKEGCGCSTVGNASVRNSLWRLLGRFLGM